MNDINGIDDMNNKHYTNTGHEKKNETKKHE